MRDKQIKAGANDAAKELGHRLTSFAMSDRWEGEVVYAFTFDAEGQDPTVDLLVGEAIVHRSGLNLREYVRLDILDALETRNA